MPLLSVQEVSKTYRVRRSANSGLISLLGLGVGREVREKRALDGVTFQAERGEALGIVGKNGSGKSTLLKVIAGLMDPTEGVVERTGTVATLMNLGVGFNNEYTGRENVRFGLALLGMSRDEIADKEEAIIQFAGIGPFIDRTLNTYSSGMRVRLGFAVATSVEPDLLIVDEVLAVGDSGFQFRCYERMEEFVSQGGSLLFVSHDTGAVMRMCRRALWLDRGRVRAEGEALDVARAYHDALVEEKTAGPDAARMNALLKGTGEATIDTVQFFAGDDVTPSNVVRSGEALRISVGFIVTRALPQLSVGVSLYRKDGLVLAQNISGIEGLVLDDLKPGRCEVDVTFGALQVEPCQATVSVALLPSADPRYNGPLERYDVRSRAWDLDVVGREGATRSAGAFIHDVAWQIDPQA